MKKGGESLGETGYYPWIATNEHRSKPCLRLTKPDGIPVVICKVGVRGPLLI